MLISFSGNNGSGKSNLSQFLYEYLKAKSIEVLYIKEFQYFFVGWIKKMLGKKTQKIQREVIKKRNKNIFAYILPYVIWFDYFVYIRLLKVRGKYEVIIIDRYALDYLNTWIELGVDNFLVRFLYKTLPKSDIPFYIDVDPQIAFERFLRRERKRQNIRKSPKHNLSLAFYKRNRDIYKVLLKKDKHIIIDGNKTLAECKKVILISFHKIAGLKN